jgi:hypothetical protein
MTRFRSYGWLVIISFVILTCPNSASAWHDETHVAILKVAGYEKWFNGTGADMAKIKAGKIEAHNHYCNQARGTVVTPETVLGQVGLYNTIDEKGHLYGAIIASLRDYIRVSRQGKYGEYHLAFCGHYMSDLSQPLHNTHYDSFNEMHHDAIDGIINDEVLDNLDKIKVYPITITSEEELAKEVARIANLSIQLGYKLEAENRLLTKEEAYMQISYSASLFKAVLKFVGK